MRVVPVLPQKQEKKKKKKSEHDAWLDTDSGVRAKQQ